MCVESENVKEFISAAFSVCVCVCVSALSLIKERRTNYTRVQRVDKMRAKQNKRINCKQIFICIVEVFVGFIDILGL